MRTQFRLSFSERVARYERQSIRPQVEKLRRPFVRGDERLATGSGLGLSIVKKATGILGGDVALRETGPSGSVIAVRLPLSAKSL